MKNVYIAAAMACVIIASTVVYARKTAVVIPAPNNNQNQQVVTPQELPQAPLKGTEWVWLHTELPGDKILSTPKREKYVLTLTDTTVTSTTDCNTFTAGYVMDGEVISFAPFASTKMFCEDSLESEYSRQLSLATSYSIFGDRLMINLNRDAGTMIFEKK